MTVIEDKKITLKEIEHIAKLARIDLSQKEKEQFSCHLSDILGYVRQLQGVNTNDVEPVSQVTGVVNVVRKDVIEDCGESARKMIIDSFPEEKDGYIKVKQVL